MPEAGMLVVSDLHLGKAERNARRGGGFWPPYENAETLSRLEAEMAALEPSALVLLGDSFDDDACVDGMAEDDLRRITALAEGCALTWITGNHDPRPVGLPGSSAPEIACGELTLHHIAKTGAQAEISGHYHPKAALYTRGRRIRRKCFLLDARRIILPAFGAYAGGLDILSPVFDALFGADADVIFTGKRALRTPLSRLRRLAA